MKKAIFAVFLLILLCGALIYFYAPVQYTTHDSTWSNCNNYNTSSGQTTMNCILAFSGNNHIVILAFNGPTGATITESQGWTTFTIWETQATSGYTLTLACGYTGSHGGAGGDTIGISYGSNQTFMSVNVAERTDVTYTSCATALDHYGTGAGIGNGAGTVNGTFSTSSASSTNATDDIVGAATNNLAAGGINPGTGFGQIKNGIPVQALMLEASTSTVTPGSQSASFSNTSSATYQAVMALLCTGDCVTSHPTQPWFGPLN